MTFSTQQRKALLAKIFEQGSLYLVTEQSLSPQRHSEDIAQQALQGGVRLVQLRDKALSPRQRLAKAHNLRSLCDQYDALFFIDDDVDIALMCGADGVHLGQDDLPIEEVKSHFPQLLVGASTHDLIEALAAQQAGADYLNIGPIYATQTKDCQGVFLGPQKLAQIAAQVDIPYTVMGGIKQDNIVELANHGARILALVTGLSQSQDVQQQALLMTRALRQVLDQSQSL